MTEMPQIHRISRVTEENPFVRSFHFDGRIDAQPGQFVMVWVVGMDEKPFSLSHIGSNSFAITVERKGAYTRAMHGLKAGGRLGIRGPYGNPFVPVAGRSVVVAGGCGIAPLLPLICGLSSPKILLGCRTRERLLFTDRLTGFRVCTDDGSFGYKGPVTDALEEELGKEKPDMVYTCGPEPMMKAAFELCQKHGALCQASLERFMICGIGICGQCMCDSLRMCQDGPVLGSAQLRRLEDFGKMAMIKNGTKVPLGEYYAYRTKYTA